MTEEAYRGEERWKCDDCDTITLLHNLLVAPHPFIPEDKIMGCPNCREAMCLTLVCDEPGCRAPVSSGTPTPDGYRRTCSFHRPDG